MSVNGVSNHNPAFSAGTLPFSIATTPAALHLQIKIHTYLCPNFMSWKITNSTGATIATSGPYIRTAGDTIMCGGPYADTIIVGSIVLPDTGDCYSLSLMDSNGFGWNEGDWRGPANAGIEIFSNGTLIYSKMNVGNFGSLLRFENFLTTTKTSGLPGIDTTNRLTIFPTPSKGTIYINAKSKVKIQIFDLMGHRVFYSEGIDNNSAIDVSKLASGIYITRIVGLGNEIRTQKIILYH